MLERMDHVNLVVADLAAMTAFYRDALGLRVTRDITIGGPWIEALTGLADVEADVVALRAAGAELLSGVQTVPTAQVEFGDRQKQIVYCRDPEGNLLELCDYR
jgi:catechol 2,3-dioxygenase-like lactoylglutathione lyase family enzyme